MPLPLRGPFSRSSSGSFLSGGSAAFLAAACAVLVLEGTVLHGAGLLGAGLALEEKAPERVEPSMQAPTGRVLEWTSAQGQPYWYRLPRKVDPNAPPSLLLMLHGTGLKWGWAFWNYPIAQGSFRGGDIVVAPEGMTEAQGGTFNFIQGKADGDQIAGLIQFFRKQFRIGRVYLYGHSQGAFFAYWFAGEHPELVDGVVAHAGNVLPNVKHPRLARERVAVAILHGKADQVVPVDCAYRTEEIYRKNGYRKLKLEVVEGLTPQSGHWPLPRQVADLLAWLDSVSADSPGGAIDVALHALAGEEPDLRIVVETTGRAERLLRGHRGADRASLVERHAALLKLLEEVQEAHAKALAASAGEGRGDSAFGAWATHFRAANAALEPLPSWRSSMRALRQRAEKHDAAIAAARSQLEKSGGKSFAGALKVMQEGFLGQGHPGLVAHLERVAAAPASGVKPEEVKRFREEVERRRASGQEGLEAARKIDREQALAFREKHAAWFEQSSPGG